TFNTVCDRARRRLHRLRQWMYPGEDAAQATSSVRRDAKGARRQSPSSTISGRMKGAGAMHMKLEVVVVPVADVDRAKKFYEALGWREDADFVTGADFRVVQLTPPGSACSVIFGTGITSAAPGSADGLQLVVDDIEAARAELASRGVEVSGVFHDAGGVFHS